MILSAHRPLRLPVLAAAVLSAILWMSTPSRAAPSPNGDPVVQKLVLARQAEAVGSFDDAVRIYREVLAEDPGDERAFWGLVRAYRLAGQYEDGLIPLLTERLDEFPNDVQARMELGEAYATLGDHDRAHSLWLRALEHGPADGSRYSEVGTMEIRHRMFEHALETFTLARERFRNATLFSQELAQIHTLLADYDRAIDECLNTVKQRRGTVQWATNRVELMLDEGASSSMVARRFEDVARSETSTAEQINLAGSVFLALGRPEQALAAFLKSDAVSGGDGKELMEYGAILRGEGLLDEARDAYLMVVERYTGTSAAAAAGIAAARILAELGDTVASVDELRLVSNEHAGSSRGAQALFEAARLELDSLEDAEASLVTLSELRERFGGRLRRMNPEIMLTEADAHVALGRFDMAYERIETLLAGDAEQELRQRAMFLRGYISFLRNDSSSAMDELRAMVESGPSGALVNDALRLMLVLSEAEESGVVEPVELLAAAEAARLAGDDARATDLLSVLADNYAETGAAVEALMSLGEMASDAGDPRRALAFYARVSAATPAITPRAEAAMRRGDILSVEMGKTAQALREYTSILEDLPSNFLSGEARRKIDRLRKSEVQS